MLQINNACLLFCGYYRIFAMQVSVTQGIKLTEEIERAAIGNSRLSTLQGAWRTSWKSSALHSRPSGAISTRGYTLHVSSMK